MKKSGIAKLSVFIMAYALFGLLLVYIQMLILKAYFNRERPKIN